MNEGSFIVAPIFTHDFKTSLGFFFGVIWAGLGLGNRVPASIFMLVFKTGLFCSLGFIFAVLSSCVIASIVMLDGETRLRVSLAALWAGFFSSMVASIIFMLNSVTKHGFSMGSFWAGGLNEGRIEASITVLDGETETRLRGSLGVMRAGFCVSIEASIIFMPNSVTGHGFRMGVFWAGSLNSDCRD